MTPFDSNFYLKISRCVLLKARLISLPILLSILLLACSKDSMDTIDDDGVNIGSVSIDSTTTSNGNPEGNTDKAANEDDIIENSVFSKQVFINFSDSVRVLNSLQGKGVSVTVEEGDVIVKSILSEIEYILSGTTTNGSFKIYSDKKFKLTLNGVHITNADGPAINIQSGKRVFVVLGDQTTNTLADGATYKTDENEDMKATFFSEGQLIFSGTGRLDVKGNNKHAICSDDYVRMISGKLVVSGAVSDGIHTNNAFISDGGEVDITATGDGIQVEKGHIVINDGFFKINVADKGICATYETDKTIDPFVTINGGRIEVNSSGNEGIESKSVLTINDGHIVIKSEDDGLNAGTFIYINGGTTYVYSNKNDGIDSNGKVTITGGKVIAIGSGAPEAGIDCDNSTFKITGGFIVGIGGSSSLPTAEVSTQPSVLLAGNSANQLLHIHATDGTEALTFMIPRNYTTMLFSSPKLKTGKTYRIYQGGSVTGGTDFNGMYLSGTYQGGTQLSTTFTTTTMVTRSGGSVGPGGGR